MRCVSRARTFCRAPPTARRSAESAGARTCSSRSQPRARASSEAVRSSRSASSSRNRASRSFGNGVESAQTQVLADALLVLRDRLLPAGVGAWIVSASARPAEGPRTSGSSCRRLSSTRGRRRWRGSWSSSRGGSRTRGRGRQYGRAVGQFLGWCEARGLGLRDVSPLHVAAYIRTHPGSVPTVKQHLARAQSLPRARRFGSSTRAAAALRCLRRGGRGARGAEGGALPDRRPAGAAAAGRALDRRLVLAMIKRRAAAAGLPPRRATHTFRATGSTA